MLYIPNGVTLTVNGGNASGTEGAGAGIRVDPGSTLVVTGEGTLNVTGGNAANGGKGGDWRKNGSWDGSADVGSSHVDTTGGGHGGAGGGGASPAIGGIGGNGGNGGNGGDGYRTKTDGDCDKNGNDGSNGTKGNDGTSMGTLYVLGSVTVNATGGSAGSGGGGGTSDTAVVAQALAAAAAELWHTPLAAALAEAAAEAAEEAAAPIGLPSLFHCQSRKVQRVASARAVATMAARVR